MNVSCQQQLINALVAGMIFATAPPLHATSFTILNDQVETTGNGTLATEQIVSYYISFIVNFLFEFCEPQCARQIHTFD